MVILLLVTGYLIMATLSNAVDQATASQTAARNAKEAQLHTSLSVSSPAVADAHLDFNVTNNGDATIDDITDMDVIVRSIADGQVTGCEWLPFEDNPAADTDHWYVLYQVKNAPGSATSLGAEDVMRVRCIFSGTAAPATGEVTVAAPAGSTATLLYNVPVT
jgi:hypothetical protein